jgi:transcriptional regulator with XRE-family HTH domain
MPPQPPADFGGLIRQLRDQRGWTQERLAREAGITVTCISNIERGATRDPNSETIAGLAAAFDLETTDLHQRWLGEAVADRASSFRQRQAITRLLALPDRDVEAVLAFLDERSSRPKGGRTKSPRTK